MMCLRGLEFGQGQGLFGETSHVLCLMVLQGKFLEIGRPSGASQALLVPHTHCLIHLHGPQRWPVLQVGDECHTQAAYGINASNIVVVLILLGEN